MTLHDQINNILTKLQTFSPFLKEAADVGAKNIEYIENSKEYKNAISAEAAPIVNEPPRPKDIPKVFVKIQEILTILRDTPGISGYDAIILADAKDVIADIVTNPDRLASHDALDNIVVNMEVDATAKAKRPASGDAALAFDLVTPPGTPRSGACQP